MICDICGVQQYADESLEWRNGNHVHCEEAKGDSNE